MGEEDGVHRLHPHTHVSPQRLRPASVHVFGRNVVVPEATEDGMARFTFSQLCAAPLGPADYLAIARKFHTIFLRGVPKVGGERGK